MNAPGSAGKSKTYTIRVGRRGKEAWLAIEGMGNVSGQAVGSMTQLDVSPVLYIGMLSRRETFGATSAAQTLSPVARILMWKC